jgi:hypothetical protein
MSRVWLGARQDGVVIPDERPPAAPLPLRAPMAELETTRIPHVGPTSPRTPPGVPLFESCDERAARLGEGTADPDGCPGRPAAAHALLEGTPAALLEHHLEVAPAPPRGPWPWHADSGPVVEELRPPDDGWFGLAPAVDLPPPAACPPPEVLAEAAALLQYAGRTAAAEWVGGWATAGVRG